jgi:hypothetical protein
MAINEPSQALQSHKDDLTRHTGRFNALYGAAVSAEKSAPADTKVYFITRQELTHNSNCNRPEILIMNTYLKNH